MTSDLDYDPTDLEQHEQEADEQERLAALQAKQERDDFIVLMRDKIFRRFMWRLLSMTHVFRSSYFPGIDGLQIAAAEGERNIGCRLMDEIHLHCSELYSTMVKEQKDDRYNSDPASSK